MKTPIFKRSIAFALPALFSLLTFSHSALAEKSYPRKSVTLVIPYQGGITEQMGRLFGAELEKELNTPVIIDVRPGAGGVIGAKYVARAEADGYTLVISDGLSQETARGGFDTFNEFEAITSLMEQPFLLYVKSDSEIADFKGYIASAKANPKKISYGSVGPNTTAHVIGQTLEKSASIKLIHVPYRGGGAQALAVMSGEAVSGYLTAAFFKPYADAKTLRALTIVAAQRNPVYPDVPSIVELGYPELASLSSWWGVFAPKGLAPEIKDKLVNAANAIEKNGALVEFARKSGGTPLPQGPQATEQRVRNDIKFWQAFLSENKGNK